MKTPKASGALRRAPDPMQRYAHFACPTPLHYIGKIRWTRTGAPPLTKSWICYWPMTFEKSTVNQRLLVSVTTFFMFTNTCLHETSCQHWDVLADPGGTASMHPPRVQILSFWHTNFMKCSHLGSWHPPMRLVPPMGNPGSTTEMVNNLILSLSLPDTWQNPQTHMTKFANIQCGTVPPRAYDIFGSKLTGIVILAFGAYDNFILHRVGFGGFKRVVLHPKHLFGNLYVRFTFIFICFRCMLILNWCKSKLCNPVSGMLRRKLIFPQKMCSAINIKF